VVEEEIAKIFPDRSMVKLSLDHEVFHTFFDIDTVMPIPNVGNACRGGRTWEQRSETEPMIFGISDDKGRLMVLITYNSDLGDAPSFFHKDISRTVAAHSKDSACTKTRVANNVTIRAAEKPALLIFPKRPNRIPRSR
jgi:hypothetical protein